MVLKVGLIQSEFLRDEIRDRGLHRREQLAIDNISVPLPLLPDYLVLVRGDDNANLFRSPTDEPGTGRPVERDPLHRTEDCRLACIARPHYRRDMGIEDNSLLLVRLKVLEGDPFNCHSFCPVSWG